MASEKQYDFFKYIYEKEFERYKELLNRGKVFLGIISFYLSTILLNNPEHIESIFEKGELQTEIFILLSILFFILSLVLNILALSFFKYEKITNLTRVINQYGETPMSDSDFFDNRLADFAVSNERNSKKNDIRANLLLATVTALLIGIIMHILNVFIQIN